MDLKELDNYQLVLLTLLISFVSSIATAVITVYLLQQSPTVSSVINQVIQRTIEQASPTNIPDIQQPKPQTIIIKEDDLVAQSLIQGFKQVGGIYGVTTVDQPTAQIDPGTLTASAATGTVEQPVPKTTESLIALGVLIDTKGTFITSGKYQKSDGDFVKLSGGSYEITKTTYMSDSDNSILTLTPKNKATSFADIAPESTTDVPKVGQTALVIGLDGKFIKSTITSVVAPSKDATALGSVITLQHDISTKYVGAPVFSSDGKIIGIVAFDGEGLVTIRASDALTKSLSGQSPAPPTS